MRHSRSLIFATIAFVVAVADAPAWAADADTERARALFDEAGELERHGQWGPAQERLRAALRLRETPQLDYALGWALENDDKLIEAKSAYETAVRLGRSTTNGEEAARLASARLTELERNTPVIKVRTSDDGKSLRVLIDGREARRDDDTRVNPGTHVVRVERVGAEPVEQIVYVGRGSVRTLEIPSADAVAVRDSKHEGHVAIAANGSTSARKTKAEPTRGLLPWVLVSGGAAFMVGGGALFLSSSDGSDAERIVGMSCVGSGFISAAVGAVLLLRGDDTREKSGGVSRPRAGGVIVRGGGMAMTTFTF